jgi:hypothetical protein
MEGDALSSLSLAGVADSSVPLLPFFFFAYEGRDLCPLPLAGEGRVRARGVRRFAL